MNSQHSQFSSDNKTDLEALGLIKKLDNETSQVISGGALYLTANPILVNPNLNPTGSKNTLDIYNGTSSPLYFDLSFGNTISQDLQLKPGNSIVFSDQATIADVRFDGDLYTAGIQLNKTTVNAPGNYAFVLGSNGILSLV
ncbi:MAG: hypothetical protein RM022_007390 [Nostoc sp. EfeVER01]|uniref:hypothetical protein n=1 Tax=unclassified Nostoc TaxID=2593658 RepID=UPI002AD3493E|nr:MULTISPECIES: hypothetical protein [unclassified Nostoc]MDZ7948862.1 hypothetical protein [Nostoc sp. EfeVER01]MDZ7992374.1 hypothetical protein [Nostoc sp. EspVER01]